MAFYPIYASNIDTGEYCRTLFIVVAIALLVSWVVSLTLTPLQCILMLCVTTNKDQSEGSFLSYFRKLLEVVLKKRLLTVTSLLVLLIVALGTFDNVKVIFSQIRQ